MDGKTPDEQAQDFKAEVEKQLDPLRHFLLGVDNRLLFAERQIALLMARDFAYGLNAIIQDEVNRSVRYGPDARLFTDQMRIDLKIVCANINNMDNPFGKAMKFIEDYRDKAGRENIRVDW